MMKDDLYGQPTDDLVWRKSTFSNPHNCVEVAILDGGVAVRDSKRPELGALRFTNSEWRAFVLGAADKQFT